MTVIGIDLGTANTVAAYLGADGRTTHILMPREGPPIQGNVFPSFVEFDPQGWVVNVGRRAWENYGGANNSVIVWASKRLIGISFNEARAELRHLDYPIERAPDGGIIIRAGAREYTPAQIATLVLRRVKEDAGNTEINPIGRGIDRVMVSRPANFSPDRVRETKEAVIAAFPGIEVDTVPEPVAAALAYAVQFPPQQPQRVCVIDWGAGTLDVVIAILITGADGQVTMTTAPARGKANFGGIDMDDLILDAVIKEYKLTAFTQVRWNRGPAKDTAEANLRNELKDLRRGIEMSKIRLNRRPARAQETFIIKCQGETIRITLNNSKLEKAINAPLDRERLEVMLGEPLTEQRLAQMNTALDAAIPLGQNRKGNPSFLDLFRLIVLNSLRQGNFTPQDIHHVLLVGGPMHMASVRRAVREIFSGNTNGVLQALDRIDRDGFPNGIDPMECVARGAALYRGGGGRLGFDYAVPLYRTKKEGKTCFVYDKKLLKIGDPIPRDNFAERNHWLSNPQIEKVDISLLEGGPPEIVPDDNMEKRVWKKKGSYAFYPVPDDDGLFKYTITLYVESDGIKCTCYDDVADQKYHFSKLNLLDGETLNEENYIVEEWRERDRSFMSKEEIEGIRLYAELVLAKADGWLKQQHDNEYERKRPDVKYKMGSLKAALEKAPKPEDIGWEKTNDGNLGTSDSAVINAYITITGTAISLDAIFLREGFYVVTNDDLKQLRKDANALVAETAKNNGALEKIKEVKEATERLEELLGNLPEQFQGGSSSQKQDIANYLQAKTGTEVLRTAIDTARKAGNVRKGSTTKKSQ